MDIHTKHIKEVSDQDLEKVRLIFDEYTPFLNEWDITLLWLTLVVIYDGPRVVGYFNPHKGGISNYEDYYKAVPLKIAKAYQNRGIAQKVMKEFYDSHNGLVYIDNENFASLAVHRKLGFVLLRDDMVNSRYVLESGTYYIKRLK